MPCVFFVCNVGSSMLGILILNKIELVLSFFSLGFDKYIIENRTIRGVHGFGRVGKKCWTNRTFGVG